MRVLVLYATRRGSTAEVAQYITNVLREQDIDVTLSNVDQFQEDFADYDAYLFGTNIYNGMWNYTLTERIRLSLGSIGKKPVWGWAMCIRILEPDSEPYLRHNYMPETLTSKLNLQSFKFFPGKLQLDDINLDERWTLAVRYDGTQAASDFNGDFRNWDQINQWAQQIGQQLKQS